MYPQWYEIGIQLDIPKGALDNVQMERFTLAKSMIHMLEYWMQHDPSPSWSHIIDALKSPSVGNYQLAEELEEKYCGSEKQCITSRPPSERSQKAPFGCGCGKCTFFSFIKSGCPTPIPSVSSFPYLDLSGLTHEQQEELRGKLWFETREIVIKFQELVSATIQSLVTRKVSKEMLVSHVMALRVFDSVYKRRTSLHHRSFTFQSDIPSVFEVLSDFFSFFNYQVIEYIIIALGTEQDNENLQAYKKQFSQYAKRRIFECLPEFGPVSDADHADIFVKLDSHYDDYTVAEIEGFRHKLNEILCVSSQGILRLCRVEKGCIQLMFQVPLLVHHEIFPLSKEQEMALAVEGVIRLTCGEYQFQVNWFFCSHCITAAML